MMLVGGLVKQHRSDRIRGGRNRGGPLVLRHVMEVLSSGCRLILKDESSRNKRLLGLIKGILVVTAPLVFPLLG